MYFGIFGDDPMIFPLSCINKMKYTNSSPNMEPFSHCYYESHLVMLHYFLMCCSIQFANILLSVFLHQLSASIVRFSWQCYADIINRIPRLFFSAHVLKHFNYQGN